MIPPNEDRVALLKPTLSTNTNPIIMKNKLTLNLYFALAATLLAQSAMAQFVITDAGATSPTPGPNDVYAIFDSVQNNDGLNYYWDNGNHIGQTFTTGPNASGYTMTNLAIQTAGGGGYWGSGAIASVSASQTFTLTIYSIDNSGNATPVATNTAVGALSAEGHWLRWSGLGVALLPNTNYAYTFVNGDTGSGGNWEQLANNGNNPYAGGQICSIPPGGGAVIFGGSGVSDAVFDIGLAPGTVAGGTVTIADVGTTTPTPGANDISQLLPAVIPIQNNYGLNYYWDSGPGQVFTTPNSTLPWVVTNLLIKTGGGGGGELNAQAFVLRLYSVSGGTTASLIYSNSYTASLNAEGDWLQFSGLSAVLQPNQQYAYTLYRGANGSWEQMANYDGNPYPGGKVCLINPGGGTINYGSQNATNSSDAAFDVGLTAPLVFGILPSYTPNVSPIYAGTTLTLNEAALGSGTISYKWQTDGGSGGALTNIPGATSSNLVVNTTGWAAGTYSYAVVVTTTSGGGMSATSPVLPLTVSPASAPIIVSDTTPTPNTASSYVGLNQSFSVSMIGTLPIAYQWYVASDASGTGATRISGATNATLTLTNLQPGNTGYYAAVATNVISPFNATSTWTPLTVLPASQMLINWQAPVTFNGLTAAQILNSTLPRPFSFFEAAYFGGNSAPTITVTNSGNIYSFYGDGSTISVAGQSGFNGGSWLVGGNTTGDTNLDYVLNEFAYDGNAGSASIHTISLHNLIVGSNYCVQIFALDDRPPGVGRYTSFQDPADNADVSATFGDPDNMYVTGTFTAPNTDIDIQQNLLPGGAGCISAVIVGAVVSVNTNAATANFQATISGQTLNFTWSSDHQGWQIYTNAVGLDAAGNWFPVLGSATVTNFSLPIDPTKKNVFYQLRYP